MMHPEVMPAAQQSALRRIGPIATGLDFYLGGTAVAIQLGHRRSMDLDWFTEKRIREPLGLARDLKDQGIDLEVESTEEGTLHVVTDGVAFSFLEFRYPMLRPPVEWPPYGLHLASLEDLICMKLSAVAGRGARKDFIDIYAIGHAGLELGRMLDLYRQRFQVRDIGHVLFSLTYFDDAERDDMPDMLWDADWKHIKRTIERWVNGYTRDRRSPDRTG